MMFSGLLCSWFHACDRIATWAVSEALRRDGIPRRLLVVAAGYLAAREGRISDRGPGGRLRHAPTVVRIDRHPDAGRQLPPRPPSLGGPRQSGSSRLRVIGAS